MEQFVGFALPGVPFGCTYALVAVCLVLTYQATGVFNCFESISPKKDPVFPLPAGTPAPS